MERSKFFNAESQVMASCFQFQQNPILMKLCIYYSMSLDTDIWKFF